MSISGGSKPISRQEANAYIKNYRETQDIVQRASISQFVSKTGPENVKALNMSNCEWNAFIFDKATILKFFGVKELDPVDPEKNCEYLAVILGAYGDNEKPKLPGEVTVLVAGVNSKPESSNELVTLNWPEPASQHPPTRVIEFLPQAAGLSGDNQITFKIL